MSSINTRYFIQILLHLLFEWEMSIAFSAAVSCCYFFTFTSSRRPVTTTPIKILLQILTLHQTKTSVLAYQNILTLHSFMFIRRPQLLNTLPRKIHFPLNFLFRSYISGIIFHRLIIKLQLLSHKPIESFRLLLFLAEIQYKVIINWKGIDL